MGGSNRVVPEREAEPDDGLTIERAKELGGAFIPAFIIARPDLTHAQKLVWGKVCGLAGKHGYCWASNKWLGENLLMEARTVREHVQVLVDKNLLRRDVIRDEKAQVIERRLYPMWPQEASDPAPTVPPPLPKMSCGKGRWIGKRKIAKSTLARLRQHVFERDGFRCQHCAASVDQPLVLDHVIPWCLGGKTEPANLQALCGSCNSRKGHRVTLQTWSDLVAVRHREAEWQRRRSE